ncbi:DeoR/GlpR family DNA-binding transcription regulator [Georgenia faecalis]|uniref:DeoR/GlpR family DNA-binding transcription regulator n=1 Tax=Georgenia faecalis TaxID=2483799 RepID=A0ABV9D9Y7_9MICO|nr:DeoR/GlpR family DNA-binding transcription regulator [Georgenia faecalis]
MNRHERLTAVLELVVERENLHVDEIVRRLGVSAATARRDLDHLARQQLITRTRGGASPSPTSSDLPLRYRTARQAVEKQRIARAAAAMVAPGDVVGLNGGTTTTEVARELVMRPELQRDDPRGEVVVVTNAVNIANELAVRRHVRVVLTGGVMRPLTYELTGPLARGILDEISIGTLFLGVNALDPEAGAFAHHEGRAAVNAALVANARRVVAVADHTKLGITAFAKICETSALDALITDDGADPEVVDRLRASGVDVTLA